MGNLSKKTEIEQPTNHGVNFVFALLGAITSVVVSLTFFEPSTAPGSLDRNPATYSAPVAPEEFTPEAYLFYIY